MTGVVVQGHMYLIETCYDSDLKMRLEKPASDQTVPRIGDDGEEIFPAPVCNVMTELLTETIRLIFP